MKKFVCTLLLALTALPGAFAAQICNPDLPTDPSRFVVQGDEVLDLRTGLVWKRCLLGTSGSACDQGAVLLVTWSQALAAAAGESGWRLPNIKELASVVERACELPALDLQAFPNRADEVVWSASPFNGTTRDLLVLPLETGYVNSALMTERHAVWLVRDPALD